MSEFVIPNLGDGVAAGDVLQVLVKVGDTVAVDQPVLELETDKATVEVPIDVAGTMKEIRVKPGDKVKPGETVMTIDNGAGEQAPKKSAEQSEQAPPGKESKQEPPLKRRRRRPPLPSPSSPRRRARPRSRRRSELLSWTFVNDRHRPQQPARLSLRASPRCRARHRRRHRRRSAASLARLASTSVR